MRESVTKQLLFDFFDGNTTCVQRKLVEEWLGSSSAHEELFYQYLDEWERKGPQFFPDGERARQTYHALLNGRTSAVKPLELVPPPPRQLNRAWALRLAVAATVLLTAFFFRSPLLYRSYESAPGEPYAFALPDGSQVTLNANSCLRVPRFSFGHPVREVQLTGEAEFSVTHTQDHTPFRVWMDDNYQIDVLGTEFTAYSRERGKRVYLKEGKVKLLLPKGEQIYLKPGHCFSSSPGGEFSVSIPEQPQALTAWKEQAFYFDNTLLSEVVEQIKERFAITIRIREQALANRRIGGMYRAKNADELLGILSELLDMTITKKSGYIELSTTKP
ncbi:hypothetical protein GCM10027275_45540 [Rhabdobacter roseus]|uniref:Ferric-dicitrate binding protein FerR (Iron transport regulator) n=1 Tax=Rhabdobacter roseus TaxID=1655419 RepID=A0A840U363_9BACT|nr:FecR domain-containing protein [Rhabdobacter roseus]MBB5286778.1 ferric-dicitrate binding protein FerR (iron transport regulator) [Rhabdobacter roseus]